ncbi:MAG: DUF2264 domain-containing protein [Roseiflexaceae bacterium]
MSRFHAPPFSHAEAIDLWSRIVVGWANHLDASGARLLIDGFRNQHDQGGSYEGVTRMLWGLGAWFSQPNRPTTLTWRGQTIDLARITRQALVAGTDPTNRSFWGYGAAGQEYDQRTVESGQVAFATWQSRALIWNQLHPHEQANLITWLEQVGQRPSQWRSNWALFWALNHAARRGLGQPFDQATIDSALGYLELVDCGDGWYDDAAMRGAQHFDDYNLLVFTPHVLAWAECAGQDDRQRQELLLGRIRQGMQRLPFFFAANGAYPEYGRSLSYKFARLGAALWAYRMGCWPHAIGLLRRLVGRHLRWYIDQGALNAAGILGQSLTAQGSPAVRETYISTGAPYWAMLAFAGLWGMPDDDPFWHEPEQPLPVEQGDFVRVFPQPGWVLVGTQASGAVQRFNAGSSGPYPAKYEKFCYATSAPFNVGLADGQPAPDSMICLTDRQGHSHRSGTMAFAVGEPGWLQMRYQQQASGGIHTIETTLVVHGEWHLRIHQIELDPQAGPVGVVEGSAPLGYPPGAQPRIASSAEQGWEYASAEDRAVAIVRIAGYDQQFRAHAWAGRSDLNSVYAEHVLPLLGVSQLTQQHSLICLVYTGTPIADPATLIQAIPQVAITTEQVRVHWPDQTIVTVVRLARA